MNGINEKEILFVDAVSVYYVKTEFESYCFYLQKLNDIILDRVILSLSGKTLLSISFRTLN